MSIRGRIQNWPIQRKLLVIILSTVTAALLLVMVGIVSYDVSTYRNRLSQEINGLAEFIAANSAPPLAFDDAETAREIMNTLKGTRSIAVAALYTRSNELFASYVRTGESQRTVPSGPGAAGIRSYGRSLELVYPVKAKGRQVGTLFLKADMASVHNRLRGYVTIFIVVATAIAVSAFLLQRLLQRLISNPLLHFHTMAERIASGDLYTRVPVTSEDEIGQLAAAFNHMTTELARSYAEVERREEERERLISDLERSNRELRDFAKVSAHDLQEPLRILMVYSDMLNARYREMLDRKGEKYVSYIFESAKRMSSLISDVQSFSLIGFGGGDFVLVDLSSVLSDALKNLKGHMEETNAEIFHDELPQVEGDRTQLVQLFQNLIDNAIKYRRRDVSPRITISCRQEELNWLIGVHDNGIGIDSQFYDRIFVIFQRLHKREEYSGTGMGLAICRKIVERHGGRIWVESRPGEGSSFYFSLPVRKEQSNG